MQYAVRTAALVLALAVTACGGPKQEEFTLADSEAIKKSTAEFATAFNAKQIDKIVEFYGENSVLMPPNKPLLRGRDALKMYFNDILSRGGSLTMDVEEVGGHGPIAHELGTYTITYSTGERDRGKYLRVVRNMAGSWRTEKMMWSSDFPQKPSSN